MEFYVTFGKDKNKENHIFKVNGGKLKIEFSIVVSQFNKYLNKKEYAYFKSESWNLNVINQIEENKRFVMGDFYLRFFKDKNNNISWVFVVKSLVEKNFDDNKKETFNIQKEIGDIFENEEKNKWELDF